MTTVQTPDNTLFLNTLNPEQLKAVEYLDGPQLIIAGAGSGKTRVLTTKIAYLISRGYEPRRIMALTFTNKAAKEMKERIAKMVSTWQASQIWTGTFHSIFLRILRQNSQLIGFKKDFTIYDAADSRSLIKLLVKELGLNAEQYKPAKVASVISNAKNNLVSPSRFQHDGNDPAMSRLYRLYFERCKLAQAMDFDDILYYTNVLLRDNKELCDVYADYFEYILVDEYQDTNFAQSLIVEQLSRKHKALCVVGDDAQSIYSFRGANIGNILEMHKRWPDLKIFKLERNYRSTQTIVDAASSLIAHNKGRIPKNVYSENNKGELIEVQQAQTDYEEAALVAGAVMRRMRRSGSSAEQCVILYRTNAQSRQIEEALRRKNLPYRIYGGLTFYQRKEVKDAIAYFRLVVNQNDDEALRRIINFPARGIGDTTMKKISAAAMQHSLSLWEVMQNPLNYGVNINKGTLGKLETFVKMITSLSHNHAETDDAYALAQDIYNRTGMMKLYGLASTPEEISKSENLNELLNGVKEFADSRKEIGLQADMASFLQEISLLTDQDAKDGTQDEKITLMTVHSAKGLEYKHVFIVGMEDELFPSSQSHDTTFGLEEERRLFYVAITRAEETCFISYALQRFRNGSTDVAHPSRFLMEIDPKYLSGMAFAKSSFSPSPIHTNVTRGTNSFRSGNIDNSLAQRLRNLRKNPIVNAPSSDVAAATASQLKPGTLVMHQKFGRGVVKNVIPGDSEMAVVDFKTFGEKKLILRFARLIIEK